MIVNSILELMSFLGFPSNLDEINFFGIKIDFNSFVMVLSLSLIVFTGYKLYRYIKFLLIGKEV